MGPERSTSPAPMLVGRATFVMAGGRVVPQPHNPPAIRARSGAVEGGEQAQTRPRGENKGKAAIERKNSKMKKGSKTAETTVADIAAVPRSRVKLNCMVSKALARLRADSRAIIAGNIALRKPYRARNVR